MDDGLNKFLMLTPYLLGYFPLFPAINSPRARRRQMQIDISEKAKAVLKQDIMKIKELIESERMPNVSKGKQCSYCEMKRFCT